MPAALKEGKETTLESLDSAFKFKFPFLQSRAFGMLFFSSARNRIWKLARKKIYRAMLRIILLSDDALSFNYTYAGKKIKCLKLFFIDKS